jgi:hypothetical protein
MRWSVSEGFHPNSHRYPRTQRPSSGPADEPYSWGGARGPSPSRSRTSGIGLRGVPLPRTPASGVELSAASRHPCRVQGPEPKLWLQDRSPRARRSHFGIESRRETAADSPGPTFDVPEASSQKGGPADQLQCPALDAGNHPTSPVNPLTTETQNHRERITFGGKESSKLNTTIPIFLCVSVTLW